MTGGWAATNTLRETRDFIPDWYDGPLSLRDEYDAALALVEAALDAAADGLSVWERVPSIEQADETFAALAAALRAVREGK